jgi:hypothetical protein
LVSRLGAVVSARRSVMGVLAVLGLFVPLTSCTDAFDATPRETMAVVGYKADRICLVDQNVEGRFDDDQPLSACYKMSKSFPVEPLPIGACIAVFAPSPSKFDKPARLRSVLEKPCDIPAGQIDCIWKHMQSIDRPQAIKRPGDKIQSSRALCEGA